MQASFVYMSTLVIKILLTMSCPLFICPHMLMKHCCTAALTMVFPGSWMMDKTINLTDKNRKSCSHSVDAPQQFHLNKTNKKRKMKIHH